MELLAYEEIFKKGDRAYAVLDGLFYEINYDSHKVKEVDFDEMFIEYLFSSSSVKFKKFMRAYIRLCINTIGINFDYIKTIKDLDAVEELFFTQENQLVDEDES